MRQGEIWLVNLDPTVGSEIRKTRPCVILNDDAIGSLPLKVVAPVTECKKHYASVPWMVRIDPSSDNGLEKASVIDAFQIRSLAQERLTRKLGNITSKDLEKVKAAVMVVLGG